MKNIIEAINNLSEAITYIKKIRKESTIGNLGVLEMNLKYVKALLEENEEMIRSKEKEKSFEEKLDLTVVHYCHFFTLSDRSYFKEVINSLINEYYIPKSKEEINLGEINKVVNDNFWDLVEKKEESDGYYYLKEGDVIQKEDEYYDLEWNTTSAWGETYKESFAKYRRKLPVKKEEEKEIFTKKDMIEFGCFYYVSQGTPGYWGKNIFDSWLKQRKVESK